MANDSRFDHRRPGGRLAGAPEDTAAFSPTVPVTDTPTISDAVVGYMAARLYAAEQRHLLRPVPVTFEDQQRYLMDKAFLMMAARDLAHYRDLAKEQREQEREGEVT